MLAAEEDTTALERACMLLFLQTRVSIKALVLRELWYSELSDQMPLMVETNLQNVAGTKISGPVLKFEDARTDTSKFYEGPAPLPFDAT